MIMPRSLPNLSADSYLGCSSGGDDQLGAQHVPMPRAPTHPTGSDDKEVRNLPRQLGPELSSE